MKKIAKVIIKNFQIHRDLEIDFSDITAIVGPSASGKSAVIRAIKWCLYNDAPLNFQRKGAEKEETSCRIIFSDSSYVERSRKGKENKYILCPPNGDEVVYTAFGASYFDVVTDFTGIKPVELFGGQSNINLQEQHDPIFFMGESQIKKANLIGSVGKIEVIDDAISITMGEIREHKKQLEFHDTELDEKRRSLQERKYSEIELFRKDLNIANLIDKEADSLENQLSEVSSANKSVVFDLSNLENSEKIIVKLRDIDDAKKIVSDTEIIISSKDKIEQSKKIIEKSISDIIDSDEVIEKINEKSIISSKKLISEVEKLLSNTKTAESALDTISTISCRISSTKELLESFELLPKTQQLIKSAEELNSTRGYVDEIMTLSEKLQLASAVFEMSEESFDKSKVALSEFIKENPTCPLCGNQIEQ